MKVLALSYLFPSPAHPEYGNFVYNRLKALQNFCEMKVIAPLQRYPFRGILRPKLKRSGKIDLNENMGGIEAKYPKFTVIPRYFKVIDALSYYAAVKPIVNKMIQEGFAFDVIDTHWTYPDILSAYFLSKRYKKPFIVTVRGKEALYLSERGGRKLILDWCLRRASAVVALSPELADLVVNIGVERHKVRVILNGVDTGSFHQLDKIETRKKLGLPLDKKLLVAVGRLTEAKGHQHIIQSLPTLAFQHDVELHIIGGINPESDYSSSLKEQVAKLGLSNVFFHNGMPHEQLLYWYNAADLFCLASHGEGCPNVVLEAMACGTPVVVTDVGAITDIVESGSDGFIVKDLALLSETIKLGLTVEWNRLLIEHKMALMTWQTCAEKVHILYQELINKSCS